MRRIGERIIPHALRRRAAADLEGFAHSAAAGTNSAYEAPKGHLTHFKYRLEACVVDFSLNYRLPVDKVKVFSHIINDFAIFFDSNSILEGLRRPGAQPGPRNPEMSEFFM